jgi:hypothetical protein
MLAELKPSKEHTGGAWYTDQTFDAEFVNVLKQQCVQFVVRQVRVLYLERERESEREGEIKQNRFSIIHGSKRFGPWEIVFYVSPL